MSLKPNAGWYFQSLEEARDWLDFETDGYEQERASYAENDRYNEWVKWRGEFWRTLDA